jgi:hypothetical protein
LRMRVRAQQRVKKNVNERFFRMLHTITLLYRPHGPGFYESAESPESSDEESEPWSAEKNFACVFFSVNANAFG